MVGKLMTLAAILSLFSVLPGCSSTYPENGLLENVQTVRHGFGLGIGTSAEGWINDAVKFWEKHIDK